MGWEGFGLDLGGGLRLVPAGLARWWLWSAAGVIALGLMVVLYRTERRLVSRRTGLALLALRGLAALALVAALFEPIAERSQSERVRGRVVLGVDLSESMATTDPDRPAEQSEALRRLLDLSPSVDPGAMSRHELTRRLLEAGLARSPGVRPRRRGVRLRPGDRRGVSRGPGESAGRVGRGSRSRYSPRPRRPRDRLGAGPGAGLAGARRRGAGAGCRAPDRRPPEPPGADEPGRRPAGGARNPGLSRADRLDRAGAPRRGGRGGPRRRRWIRARSPASR